MKAEFIKNYHNSNSLYINEKNKWLWLRIHKNAGTSMYDDFLYKHCINESKSNTKDKSRVIKWRKNITDEKLEDYVVWTFVRNPYDRFNSMAAMFGSDPNKFAEGFHRYTGKGIIERHTRPQHLFTHYKGESMVDLTFRFERLQKDFNTLCFLLDLPEHDLKKLNSSKHRHWKDEMNRKTINFVNKYYKEDFEYFNYEMI